MAHLGMKTREERVETDTHSLGDVLVGSHAKTVDGNEAKLHFAVTVADVTGRQYLEYLTIHQLRDLRTLLNHILGEEGS